MPTAAHQRDARRRRPVRRSRVAGLDRDLRATFAAAVVLRVESARSRPGRGRRSAGFERERRFPRSGMFRRGPSLKPTSDARSGPRSRDVERAARPRAFASTRVRGDDHAARRSRNDVRDRAENRTIALPSRNCDVVETRAPGDRSARRPTRASSRRLRRRGAGIRCRVGRQIDDGDVGSASATSRGGRRRDRSNAADP